MCMWQKVKMHCRLIVASSSLPRIHSPRPLVLTMLSPPLAALVAVSLLVTIYRVLRGRHSAAIRRLRGPPSPSVLLGESCFRDDRGPRASRTDELRMLGHERALSTQNEVGELESQWLHEYGPTWRISGSFGVSPQESAADNTGMLTPFFCTDRRSHDCRSKGTRSRSDSFKRSSSSQWIS